MKKIIPILLFIFFSTWTYAWGPTGHRATAQIAQNYLNNRSLKKITELLDGRSMAFFASYADEIRSDERYRAFETWHYVNFDEDNSYYDSPPNPKGDLVIAINTCIDTLKSKTSTKQDKTFYLKLLIHFMGDLHQPLHVGHAADWGGNKLKVDWFKITSNLHRVWDENMIEHYAMSYTELTNSYPKLSRTQYVQLSSGTLMDWVCESNLLAEDVVYPSINSSTNLSYEYMYHYSSLLLDQLQKGGVRLAKILNETF